MWSTMTLARSLFRFTAVRPAQKVRPDTEADRFLRPGGAMTAAAAPAPLTELPQAIATSGSLVAARELAQEHILSPRYVRGFDDRDPTLAYLARVYAAAV